MNTEDFEDFASIADQAAKALKEMTPAQIAALFDKYHLRPTRGQFFIHMDGEWPQSCCGVGAVIYDLARNDQNREQRENLESIAARANCERDVIAFTLGFDGKGFPFPYSTYDEHKDLYAKGRRVWELVTQQKEHTHE